VPLPRRNLVSKVEGDKIRAQFAAEEKNEDVKESPIMSNHEFC